MLFDFDMFISNKDLYVIHKLIIVVIIIIIGKVKMVTEIFV